MSRPWWQDRGWNYPRPRAQLLLLDGQGTSAMRAATASLTLPAAVPRASSCVIAPWPLPIFFSWSEKAFRAVSMSLMSPEYAAWAAAFTLSKSLLTAVREACNSATVLSSCIDFTSVASWSRLLQTSEEPLELLDGDGVVEEELLLFESEPHTETRTVSPRARTRAIRRWGTTYLRDGRCPHHPCHDRAAPHPRRVSRRYAVAAIPSESAPANLGAPGS